MDTREMGELSEKASVYDNILSESSFELHVPAVL